MSSGKISSLPAVVPNPALVPKTERTTPLRVLTHPVLVPATERTKPLRVLTHPTAMPIPASV